MSTTRPLPDFTGVWEMNFERSVLRGPALQRVVITIEHRASQLNQELVATRADGAQQRMLFTYVIGAETSNTMGGAILRTRARWEGLELVLESRMQLPGREACFKDHWSLSDDGQTLTMAHRDDDLAGQISVLERSR